MSRLSIEQFLREHPYAEHHTKGYDAFIEQLRYIVEGYVAEHQGTRYGFTLKDPATDVKMPEITAEQAWFTGQTFALTMYLQPFVQDDDLDPFCPAYKIPVHIPLMVGSRWARGSSLPDGVFVYKGRRMVIVPTMERAQGTICVTRKDHIFTAELRCRPHTFIMEHRPEGIVFKVKGLSTKDRKASCCTCKTQKKQQDLGFCTPCRNFYCGQCMVSEACPVCQGSLVDRTKDHVVDWPISQLSEVMPSVSYTYTDDQLSDLLNLMHRTLMDTVAGDRPVEDPYDPIHRRIMTAGTIFEKVLLTRLRSKLTTLSKKDVVTETAFSGFKFEPLLDLFEGGSWPQHYYAQELQHETTVKSMAHIRRINRNIPDQSGWGPRQLTLSWHGQLCPIEIKENNPGKSTGLAAVAFVTPPAQTNDCQYLRQVCRDFVGDDDVPSVQVFVGGDDVPSVQVFINMMSEPYRLSMAKARELVNHLRQEKIPQSYSDVRPHVPRYMTMSWEPHRWALFLYTDHGRLVRPVRRLDAPRDVIDHQDRTHHMLRLGYWDMIGVMPHEASVAMADETPDPSQHTHQDLHMGCMYSLVTNALPWMQHNWEPRPMFATNHQLQAEAPGQLDNAYYAQYPLAKTAIQHHTIPPNGINCKVAFMPHQHNKDDGIVMRQGFAELNGFRGHLAFVVQPFREDPEAFWGEQPWAIEHGTHAQRLWVVKYILKRYTKRFVASVLKTAIELYEAENSEDHWERVKTALDKLGYCRHSTAGFERFDPVKDVGDDDYVFLRQCRAIPRLGSFIACQGYALMKMYKTGRMTTDNKPQWAHTFIKAKYASQFVEVIMHARGPRLRCITTHAVEFRGGVWHHKLNMKDQIDGNKVAARHGQKGTVTIVPDIDLPWCQKDGTVCDLFINPHSLPTRLTLGYLREALETKVALGNCQTVDATSFTTAPMASTDQEREPMIHPQHGIPYAEPITTGYIYFHSLPHKAHKVIHSVGHVRKEPVYGQRLKGKAVQGGIRIGNQERENLIANSAFGILHELFMESGDGTDVNVCGTCFKYQCVEHDARDLTLRVPGALKPLMSDLATLQMSTHLLKEEELPVEEEDQLPPLHPLHGMPPLELEPPAVDQNVPRCISLLEQGDHKGAVEEVQAAHHERLVELAHQQQDAVDQMRTVSQCLESFFPGNGATDNGALSAAVPSVGS